MCLTVHVFYYIYLVLHVFANTLVVIQIIYHPPGVVSNIWLTAGGDGGD